MIDYIRDGQAIYRQSFATIRAEANLAGIPADLEKLAVRVIHACGMVDVVDDLRFSPGAGAAGRAALAAWSLTRAPLRRIHSMNAAAQFAHSMATLLAAGLPLPRALEVTANVVSNYTFSLAVRQVRQDVERGRPMAESMAGIECFPAMLTEMVGVGERSGSLEETLDVIGDYYDNEVSVTTARLLAVLEPIITICLAVLVVVLLLAVYLPMFTLYGGI